MLYLAASPNGVSSLPNKPVATTTYSPPSSNVNGNSAILRHLLTIPTVNSNDSSTPVAVLYSKPNASAPSTYTSTVGCAVMQYQFSL